MKKTITIFNFIAVALLITATACNSDDNNQATTPTPLSIQDLDVSIDENPTNGQVIGTPPAAGQGTLVYIIDSQTPAGATEIDPATGELTVADETLFDFETNPTINVTISVSNSTDTETGMVEINLNDVDAIESLLSTSQTNYAAANSGDWILITETEYENLATNLNNTTRAGTTIAEYNSVLSSQTGGAFVFSNFTNTSLIPSNAYVFAFKYKVYIASNKTGVRIKQSSTANNSGFSDIGNALPSHSGNSQDLFFVLKGNTTAVTANGYLGFDQQDGNMSLFSTTQGNGAYWNSLNSSILAGQYSDQKVFYQGLSTTQMQW